MEIERVIDQVEKLYEQITGHAAPTTEHPYSPLNQNEDIGLQVEKRLEQLMWTLQDPTAIPQPKSWTPQMNVWENEKETLLRIDLPGVTKEDIDLSIQDQVLTVRGYRRSFNNEGYQLRSTEQSVGPFTRSIMLPATITTHELHSKVVDGVLEIALPRGPIAKSEGKTKSKGKKSVN